MTVTAKPFLQFAYTDPYGNRSLRTAFMPIEIICRDYQWMLAAYDVEADRMMTFTLRNCDFARTGLAMAGVERSIDQLAEHLMNRFDVVDALLTECQAIVRRLISAEAMEPATGKFETPPPWAGKDNQ